MNGPWHTPVVVAGGAHPLAGGWLRFDQVDAAEGRSLARFLPEDRLSALTAPRAPLAGMAMDRPNIMGILNVTPDSFSDGGRLGDLNTVLRTAEAMVAAGADILDIGGESTRPGAAEVAVAEEIDRTAPVIAAIKAEIDVPISIDTRKAPVAQAAVAAGADLINDVSAMVFDPDIAQVAAQTQTPICLMHAKGTPETMQNDPRYGDVLTEVLDHLAERVNVALAAGIPQARILVDPGIGFGKTLDHNLTLLQGLAALHSLGLPVLLGASRKRFIGTLSGVETADQRVAGSLAVALAGVAQGAQVLRVHDVAQTRQALTLWQAATGTGPAAI